VVIYGYFYFFILAKRLKDKINTVNNIRMELYPLNPKRFRQNIFVYAVYRNDNYLFSIFVCS